MDKKEYTRRKRWFGTSSGERNPLPCCTLVILGGVKQSCGAIRQRGQFTYIRLSLMAIETLLQPSMSFPAGCRPTKARGDLLTPPKPP